ncbi:MAG: type IV pilus assembly protein PilQ, partial [bacterium]
VISILLLLLIVVAKNSTSLTTVATSKSQVQISEIKQASQINKPLAIKYFGEPGFKGDLISIDIREVELYDMLRFFSDNYGLNFVVDKSVPKMIVTMKVNDIPWGDALTSVLETNNLTYKVENTVVRIVPRDYTIIPEEKILDKDLSNKRLRN